LQTSSVWNFHLPDSLNTVSQNENSTPSHQLLVRLRDLEATIRSDVSKQFDSLVDQICLLGRGPAFSELTGIPAASA